MLADAYTKRGDNYLEQEKYTEAINDFTQAIQFNSNDANIYFGRGIAYFGKEQYSQAINDYKQALKLDPKLANTVNP
jgi:tetratricopeptide (TPR) repeat protein